jgi:hypothetical protein
MRRKVYKRENKYRYGEAQLLPSHQLRSCAHHVGALTSDESSSIEHSSVVANCDLDTLEVNHR